MSETDSENNLADVKSKEFNSRCGEILRKAVFIEDSLEFFISDYFSIPKSYRANLMRDTILLEINFSKKIKVFEEICKMEHIDQNKIKSVLKSLNLIREVRNKVAHYQALVIDPKLYNIVLLERKSVQWPARALELTSDRMMELEKHSQLVYNGIIDIFLELNDPKRKPTIEEW